MNIYRIGENLLEVLRLPDIQWLSDQNLAIVKATQTQSLTDYSQFGTIKKAARALVTTAHCCRTWLGKIQKKEFWNSSISKEFLNCYEQKEGESEVEIPSYLYQTSYLS